LRALFILQANFSAVNPTKMSRVSELIRPQIGSHLNFHSGGKSLELSN